MASSRLVSQTAPCAGLMYSLPLQVRVASRYFKGPELLVDLQVCVCVWVSHVTSSSRVEILGAVYGAIRYASQHSRQIGCSPGEVRSAWVAAPEMSPPACFPAYIQVYDYSLDMWSLGAMLAAMIFK